MSWCLVDVLFCFVVEARLVFLCSCLTSASLALPCSQCLSACTSLPLKSSLCFSPCCSLTHCHFVCFVPGVSELLLMFSDSYMCYQCVWIVLLSPTCFLTLDFGDRCHTCLWILIFFFFFFCNPDSLIHWLTAGGSARILLMLLVLISPWQTDGSSNRLPSIFLKAPAPFFSQTVF